MDTESVYLLIIEKVSRTRMVKDGKEFTTTTTYLKAPCIGLIKKLVSFCLQYNHNDSWKLFQVWDSHKIATWPVKHQVLGDYVRKYTTERSASGMNNCENIKIRSLS